MKKIILTSLSLITCTLFTYAQGTISLQEGKGTVFTNGPSIGQGDGPAYAGNSSYYYDVLDMTAESWASLSATQKASANNLLANPSDVYLWMDSGLTGVNAGLTAGGITGFGGTTGAQIDGWPAPSGSTYNSAPDYDYYIVVGWSANEGASWSTVSDEVVNDSFPAIGWYGESAVMYNYAGSGTLTAPNVFSPSGFTGLAGSGAGNTPANPELVLLPVVPEPASLALAGLGGISMFFFRRRNRCS